MQPMAISKATKIKSIKFYCQSPKTSRGELTGYDLKSTFHSPGEGEVMTYSIDTGPTGTLTVTIGSTTYVYKLSDIAGRIEITA